MKLFLKKYIFLFFKVKKKVVFYLKKYVWQFFSKKYVKNNYLDYNQPKTKIQEIISKIKIKA